MYLISSFQKQLEMGLAPKTLLMFCSYLCINPSSLHCASELSHTCCPVGRNRLWIPCHFFLSKIILHLLIPIMVSILLFFFSLPLSLLSPLNLVAGFGRKNKSFCCNEKRVSFISIHKYILLLLFTFLFLSPGHYALIFISVKSGRQRERCTQSLKLVLSPPLSSIPTLFSFQLQAVRS